MPVSSSCIQARRCSWVSEGRVLADRWAMVTLVLRRVFFAKTKKVRIELRGRGAGGEPVVDVLLGAGRGGAVVGLVEPVEELDGFGDLLFGGVDRSAVGPLRLLWPGCV